MIVSPEFVESAILHLTGSKMFNIQCRKIARTLGFRLSQYGLLNDSGEKVAKTELEILEVLGMLDFHNPVTRSI